MPQALAMAYGLDWETEIRSFWSWYKDAREAIEGAESSSLVRELVAGQEQAIEEAAIKESQPEVARLVLRVAVALVGLHYASNQKLLAALREQGVLQMPVPAPEAP
ncbi:MAG TPA: hypothetical protein VNN10_00640 [Dehalococcoidia bacterium]|nr:hypothetical protein [Dehalococcoidia bacterium]